MKSAWFHRFSFSFFSFGDTKLLSFNYSRKQQKKKLIVNDLKSVYHYVQSAEVGEKKYVI